MSQTVVALHTICPSHDNFMSMNIYLYVVSVLATLSLSLLLALLNHVASNAPAVTFRIISLQLP